MNFTQEQLESIFKAQIDAMREITELNKQFFAKVKELEVRIADLEKNIQKH